jgi:cell division protein FtsI/penicillin-binding protein 2
LLPLIHYRYLPINLAALRLRYNEKDLKTSIDARLQVDLTRMLERELQTAGLTKGAIVVLDPQSGDLLANVSYPFPLNPSTQVSSDVDSYSESDRLIDRGRLAERPPGSTFKILTAMAAVRRDPGAFNRSYSCEPLGGGRNGKMVRGRPVRDNDKHAAHGDIRFESALTQSCNAFFAQLGVEVAGANELFRTAKIFNIQTATPDVPEKLDRYLPQSSFGQGEVLATPFQMAKIAATVANHGSMPFGRWVIDENNIRKEPPVQVIMSDQADVIAQAMLGVTSTEAGTAFRVFSSLPLRVAGKTGTAQNGVFVNGKFVFLKSHSWFVGFAPFDREQRIAFAVLVENGGYGSVIAAEISRKLVIAAADRNLI